MRERLRKVGEIVRSDAQAKFVSVDARSAAGYRVYVRQRGVSVEQRLGRTTGKHPEYGAMQMRQALEPALEENTDAVEQELELALDDICDIVEKG